MSGAGKIHNRRNESGQALVFAAVTFFALAIMALMIYGISESTSGRMEAQQAADAGAYAGAETLANCVSQMAWLNENMARLYYQNMHICADCIVTGVHAEFINDDLQYGSWPMFEPGTRADPRSAREISDWVALPSASGGYVYDVVGAFTEAKDRYDEYITAEDANNDKLKRMSRTQRGIAYGAPWLLEHQAIFTSLKNMGGLDDTQDYDQRPWAILWPRLNFNVNSEPSLIIMDLWRTTQTNGYEWVFDGVQPEGFYMSVEEEIAPEAGVDRRWTIEESEPIGAEAYPAVTTKITIDQSTQIGNRTEWDIDILTNDPRRIATGDSADENEHVQIIQLDNADGGDPVYIIVSEGYTVTTTDDDPPVYIIDDGNNVTRLRQGEDGYTEYWDSSSNEWVSLGGETTTRDGVELPITWDPRIELTDTITIWITDPLHIFMDELDIILSDPLRFTRHTPFGWIRVDGDTAWVEGLSTNDASPRYLPLPYSNGQSDHRLMEYGTGWRYERRNFGGVAQEMPFRKFAQHAMMDNDPVYRDNMSGNEARYATICLDEDTEAEAQGQTSSDNRWYDFPAWAQPDKPEDDSSDANKTPGGFFDITSGAAFSDYAYYQTRSCWYCTEDYDSVANAPASRRRFTPQGPSAGTIENFDPEDPRVSNNNGNSLEIARPAGFWYEGFTEAEYTQYLQYLAGNTPYRGVMGDRLFDLRNAWINSELRSTNQYPYYPYDIYNYDSNLSGQDALKLSDGKYSRIIQVICPVCAWKHHLLKTSTPNYREHGVPYARTDDPDQTSFVRKYNSDVNSYYTHIMTPSDAADGWLYPMELRSEFFRKGLTCVTWKPAAESDFFDDIGGERSTNTNLEGNRTGMHNPLQNHGWGNFGIATARVVFNDYDTINEDRLNGLKKVYEFEWGDTDEDKGEDRWPLNSSWVWNTDEYNDPGYGRDTIDPLLRPTNGYRESWICSHNNLFEPHWKAMLVSNRKTFHLNDIYTVEDFEQNRVGNDNATSYMLRRIWTGFWCQEMNDLYEGRRWGRNLRPRNFWRGMQAPPMQVRDGGTAQSIDMEDYRIEDIMRH